MNIVDAYKIACEIHAGQVDKSGHAYIEHLTRVYMRVVEAGGDEFIQIAALLHDSIEDHIVTAEDLRERGVPESSIHLVILMTKEPGTHYNDYISSLRDMPRAVLLKRCDIADNMDPDRLAELRPEQAKRLREKYTKALAILDCESI